MKDHATVFIFIFINLLLIAF